MKGSQVALLFALGAAGWGLYSVLEPDRIIAIGGEGQGVRSTPRNPLLDLFSNSEQVPILRASEGNETPEPSRPHTPPPNILVNEDFEDLLYSIPKNELRELFVSIDTEAIPLIGGSDSRYDRRNIEANFGWSPAEYQERWEAIIGETLGGSGAGKVSYPLETALTGMPLMTSQEFQAYGYGNQQQASNRGQVQYTSEGGYKSVSLSKSEARRIGDPYGGF